MIVYRFLKKRPHNPEFKIHIDLSAPIRFLDEPQSPALDQHLIKPAYQHTYQEGGSNCRAGQIDGIICPEDSCDIDDGVRHESERKEHIK